LGYPLILVFLPPMVSEQQGNGVATDSNCGIEIRKA